MKKVDLLGTLGNVSAQIPVDKGRLLAVSVTNQNALSKDGQAFIRIGMFRDQGVGGPIVTMFASGYVGFLTPLFWHGNIPLEPDMSVFLFARSVDDATVDFSVITDIGNNK